MKGSQTFTIKIARQPNPDRGIKEVSVKRAITIPARTGHLAMLDIFELESKGAWLALQRAIRIEEVGEP